MQDSYDVLVVGAGPAGSAAALVAARAGLSVLLLERGQYPGAKNVSGAAFYGTRLLEPLLPGFAETAPIERYIAKRAIGFLSDRGFVTTQFATDRFAQEPYNGVIILRPKFDRWFAEKAVEAGAQLVPSTVVDGLLVEQGQVVGVRVRRDAGEIRGRVVIAADGANSFLAKEAGLQRPFKAEEMSLGVKEVLELPRQVIEERFQLEGDEGAVFEFLGSITGAANGGAFLYTNRDSLSVGLIVQISSLGANRARAYDLLDQFKRHPAVAPLVRGSQLREYSAHLVPEGGWEMVPQLYTSGMMVVGDAAAFVLAAGLYLEGINYAIQSGIAAAETAILGHERNDFSAATLAHYKKKLDKTVLQDFQKYRGAAHFINNPRLQNHYPGLATDVVNKVFTVNGQPKVGLRKAVWSSIREHPELSIRSVVRDLWNAVRIFG